MADQRAMPGGTPDLSVVMPTKNVGPWVAEAVHSVLTQSVSDIELIVVDDGSTDDTLEVLRGIDDPRLRVIESDGGRGGGTARNIGVSLARGTYLAFADGDDLVPEGGYAALLGQARRTRAEMVVANYVIFSPTTLNSRQEWFPLYGRTREGISIADEPRFLRDRVCWNRVFLRDAWEAAGIRFADAPRSNDIQAMTDAYCAFAFDVLPDAVYMYRRRAGSSSMTARRTAPESVVAHFTQELGCLASVRRLQNPGVMASYAREMLDNDVWAHFGPLVDLTLVDDPAYDAARETALRFIRPTLPIGGRDLDAAKRAIYTLAVAGRWHEAADLYEQLRRTPAERTLRAPDVARTLRAAGTPRQAATADALRLALLDPLRQADALDDAQLLRVTRRARRFAHTQVAPWALRREERHLVAARPSRGANAVRAHVAEPTPPPRLPMRAARHAVDDARLAIDAARRVGGRASRRAVDVARRLAHRLPGPVQRSLRAVVHRFRRR